MTFYQPRINVAFAVTLKRVVPSMLPPGQLQEVLAGTWILPLFICIIVRGAHRWLGARTVLPSPTFAQVFGNVLGFGSPSISASQLLIFALPLD
jgi:hypothetical protein